jgi:transposase-like protein
LSRLRLCVGHGASGGRGSGLSPVPLSRLQSADQRAPRWGAEPDLPAQASRRRDIIAFVVFCRLRYRLTLRDLSEIMALRGIEISHEAVRDWEAKLVPVVGDALRKRRNGTRRGAGVSWYIDETYLKVRGQWIYLCRAIDRDGNLIDAMLSERRDMTVATAFFRSATATLGFLPDRVTTAGHGSHPRSDQHRAGAEGAALDQRLLENSF